MIYVDKVQSQQVWQLAVRHINKPLKVVETKYYNTQDPELLYQRASGLFFELDEEDNITIVDVTQRVCENFQANAERVTKQFYEKFKKEHGKFLEFIEGIDVTVDREWYASLMLNRLMFCYFIQKKGFLDNNKNYLKDKLKEVSQKKGKDKFYSFYRNFLLVLFHQGLGSSKREAKLKEEIGNVPYLNGGIFDQHELEQNYKEIQISDKAFERIFDFFDEYEWHLDTRCASTGRDINPDVLGYIFEKYINDRAAMGAYYTKEDITDYIGKNCIIPYLFEEVERNYPEALALDSGIWQGLKQSIDTYIYDAVKKGVNLPLPEEIAIGLDTTKPNLFERRKSWNKPASQEYALPTEIWREVVERRNRYNDVKQKIESGQITDINDFITYNLNIRQFVQDCLEETSDPEFIRHFFDTLNSITILDPTCGSGAFLFAALNILEPLYEACLQRMENFIAEAPKGTHSNFEKVLAEANAHPNARYFIYKSIILKNLYGVDIMNEAVEIAKLRLFLKLVAEVAPNSTKPNLGLEPLPDIDFNVRAGNTLVGFTSYDAVKKSVYFEKNDQIKFGFGDPMPAIDEKAEIASRAYNRYKNDQLIIEKGEKSYYEAKKDLNQRLAQLNEELNQYLAKEYGINSAKNKKGYQLWKASHKPFHWFVEFYEIIHQKKGFDVIIGNPPYLEINQIDSLASKLRIKKA